MSIYPPLDSLLFLSLGFGSFKDSFGEVLLDLSSFPERKVFFLFISVLLVLNTLVLARERVSDLFSSVSVEDP